MDDTREHDERIAEALRRLREVLWARPTTPAAAAEIGAALRDALEHTPVGNCSHCGRRALAGWTVRLRGGGELYCAGCWELMVAEGFRSGGLWGDERQAA